MADQGGAPTGPARRRSWWGWGWADRQPRPDTLGPLAAVVSERLGRPVDPRPAAEVADLGIRAPRLSPPASLAHVVSDDPEDRAAHAYGKSFRDVVRAFHGDVSSPPDLVARPADEGELAAVLDWCTQRGAAAIPYGAGSSVVGGVETGGEWAEGFPAVVSIDLCALAGVREIDPTSLAARIGAGTTGPALEDGLRPHGLTLRHFPQSFEFSTLGGWIATRSGGHFATNRTHIEDFVESVRMLTPRGPWESRRLPGSGAGPSPDRFVAGSEGILGVITEAWMRVQRRPVHRATATVRFATTDEGAEACRVLAQSGLWPSNCRLLDPGEAASGAGGTGEAMLIVGFESADHPVDSPMELALAACADVGGDVSGGARISGPGGGGGTPASGEGGRPDEAADTWRSSFLEAPYLRDAMVALGCIAETFETAVTWDRFAELRNTVTATAEKALAEVCGGGTVTCRTTHAYPDGAAPYFTVLAPSAHGDQLAAWDEVKAAVSEAILAAGGTITHHHAVGRDHRPWYDRQRPDPFAAALRAAKAELDPAGILNPGVLLDAGQPPGPAGVQPGS